MDREIISLKRNSAPYGSSLGQSLIASTLLHTLPLGGILLWQGGIDAKIGEIHLNPLTVEVVYENKNNCPRNETAQQDTNDIKGNLKKEASPREPNLAKVASDKTQNETNQSILSINEDTIIVTPCSGNPEPTYPPRAREENIQGTVHLRLTINELGRIIKAIPLPPLSHTLLEEAAIETAHQWRFTVSGPARTIVRDIPIVFMLD